MKTTTSPYRFRVVLITPNGFRVLATRPNESDAAARADQAMRELAAARDWSSHVEVERYLVQ